MICGSLHELLADELLTDVLLKIYLEQEAAKVLIRSTPTQHTALDIQCLLSMMTFNTKTI